MNKNFTEDKIKAALRAAFGFEMDMKEAHCFMLCDWFVNFNSSIKVELMRGEIYTNGQFFAILVGRKKLRAFIHYSQVVHVSKWGGDSINYLEVADHSDNAFKVTAYAFGKAFHAFIRYV